MVDYEKYISFVLFINSLLFPIKAVIPAFSFLIEFNKLTTFNSCKTVFLLFSYILFDNLCETMDCLLQNIQNSLLIGLKPSKHLNLIIFNVLALPTGVVLRANIWSLTYFLPNLIIYISLMSLPRNSFSFIKTAKIPKNLVHEMNRPPN